MVQIITDANRADVEGRLKSMHRDRKRVFVDRLNWDVPVWNGQFEIDQFDGPGATYLLECEPASGKHLASVRLLSSVGPHLLRDVFPQLCDGPIPCGKSVMELTRFCVSPDLDKPAAIDLMNRMWVSCVEYALLFGIERYTCVSHRQFLSVMLSAGWGAVHLGQQYEWADQAIGAILFTITPATLRECRRRFAFATPVLEIRPAVIAA